MARHTIINGMRADASSQSWNLEADWPVHLRAAARRSGLVVRWSLHDSTMALCGGWALTMRGAQRAARRALLDDLAAARPSSEQLNARLRHLHASGYLDEAAELVLTYTPHDACFRCGATGAIEHGCFSTWIDLSPDKCSACDGTGQNSRAWLKEAAAGRPTVAGR